MTVTDRVENTGSAPVTLLPYALAKRWPTPHTEGFYILHEGLIGVTDGTLREISYSGIRDDREVKQTTTGGWVGFTDKYWLVSLIPDQTETVESRFVWAKRGAADSYQADYLGAARQVAPGRRPRRPTVSSPAPRRCTSSTTIATGSASSASTAPSTSAGSTS